MQQVQERTGWLDRPILPALASVKVETILFTLIMILAVFSRLYILGARVIES